MSTTGGLILRSVRRPAGGKSYIARHIERYLSWLGYRTRVFNVGQYRRERVGAQVPHSFFDPDNPRGEEARRSVAMAALEDMRAWLTDDGQVAIYDATNTTRARRSTVRACCEEAGFQVLFIEMRCDDADVIEADIRSTKLSSPDYEAVAPTRRWPTSAPASPTTSACTSRSRTTRAPICASPAPDGA